MELEISSDFTGIFGEIAIGANTPKTLLKVASSMQNKYPNISFEFYSGDATDVAEHLEHVSLDFAILTFIS